MSKSKIEWTDYTLNPVTGCTKISDGCKNCYAEKMHNRLRRMGVEKYQHPFYVVQYQSYSYELLKVLKIKKPSKIFVGSMADIFHADIPREVLDFLMQCVWKNPKHTFLFLTKRSEYMEKYFNIYYDLDDMPPNLWIGVTVEDKDSLFRIDFLKAIKKPCIKFISFEPLLEDVGEIDLTGIDWVIVGGETGAGAREMIPEWAFNIYEQCVSQNVPFFFKQWGSLYDKHLKKISSIGSGILINGIFRELREFKQFPKTKEGKDE